MLPKWGIPFLIAQPVGHLLLSYRFRLSGFYLPFIRCASHRGRAFMSAISLPSMRVVGLADGIPLRAFFMPSLKTIQTFETQQNVEPKPESHKCLIPNTITLRPLGDLSTVLRWSSYEYISSDTVSPSLIRFIKQVEAFT